MFALLCSLHTLVLTFSYMLNFTAIQYCYRYTIFFFFDTQKERIPDRKGWCVKYQGFLKGHLVHELSELEIRIEELLVFLD